MPGIAYQASSEKPKQIGTGKALNFTWGSTGYLPISKIPNMKPLADLQFSALNRAKGITGFLTAWRLHNSCLFNDFLPRIALRVCWEESSFSLGEDVNRPMSRSRNKAASFFSQTLVMRKKCAVLEFTVCAPFNAEHSMTHYDCRWKTSGFRPSFSCSRKHWKHHSESTRQLATWYTKHTQPANHNEN